MKQIFLGLSVRLQAVFSAKLVFGVLVWAGFAKAKGDYAAARAVLFACSTVMLLSLASNSLGQGNELTIAQGGGQAAYIQEATISDVHRAFKSGELTAVKLVDLYLKRIADFDASTDLKAFVVLNPQALARASQLDREFQETDRFRPLHGIPVAVKDNYDTFDLQTAAGSIALEGSLPPDDSFMVRQLRDAGAIVIGKTNMDEWAFSPLKTESSILGTTRNPYDLERVPAGSSGGTAAAVSANLAMVGLGTDTGNSIRGPSAHCGLVGIRPTIGLTSRDGIVPLGLTADVGGPMCRTVEDSARLLTVLAGYDPADPATGKLEGLPRTNYQDFLNPDGLKNARIGVLRSYFDPSDTHPEVVGLMHQAMADLLEQGAALEDPFVEPARPQEKRRRDPDFRAAINWYLSALEQPKYTTLKEIVEAGKHHPKLENRLTRMVRGETPKLDFVGLGGPDGDAFREAFRDRLIQAMDALELDAIIYPTWRYPPRLIGDTDSPHGDNCQILAPWSGMPAITVPMGFTSGGLPAGLQFLGKPFAEARLIELAYAYEQATRHRSPPPALAN